MTTDNITEIKDNNEDLKEASCFSLFQAFFRLGLFTIGGGMAMVPILQQKAVEEYHWMNEEEVVDCIAVSQSLPGVVAINMATFVGFRKRGLRGALSATAGIILPSLIIIILIAAFLGRIDQIEWVQGAFMGIRAAAVGLIAWATWKMGKSVLMGKSWFAWALAIASFALVAIVGLNAAWAILGGIIGGILYYNLSGMKQADNREKEREGR